MVGLRRPVEGRCRLDLLLGGERSQLEGFRVACSLAAARPMSQLGSVIIGPCEKMAQINDEWRSLGGGAVEGLEAKKAGVFSVVRI